MTDASENTSTGPSSVDDDSESGFRSELTRIERRSAADSAALVERIEDADQEFILEAVRRWPLLNALLGDSATASELADSCAISRATVHRATNSLEDREMLAKSNGEYELTNLGTIVAQEVTKFGARAATAAALEPFLNTIEASTIPVEYFADARITRPKPRQPHASIQRIIELIEESTELRMLSTVLSPIYVDVGYREMMDGMPIEAVFDEQVIQIMLSEYEEKARETVETGNFELYVHEGLPFELFLFDSKMGMAAHDESGVAQILVECDTNAAIGWAEDLYANHRAEAYSLGLAD